MEAPPRPVLRPTGFPGFQARHVSHPVVVHDPVRRQWRLYYAAGATEAWNESAWDLWTVGVALSADRVRWRSPDVYEPVLVARAWREGEVVASEAPRAFDSVQVRPGSVLRDGTGWRMYYTGWNGAERAKGNGRVEKVGHAVGLATSPDGVSWTKAGAAVLEAGSGPPGALSVGHPSVLRARGGYHMWYEAFDGAAWRIAHAASEDGSRWTTTGVVLAPGAAGALDAAGARHPVVIAGPRGFELYYQGRSRTSPGLHVLRAVSADGVAWRVLGEVPLILDPPLRDGEGLHVGSVVVLPDGRREVYFARQTTEEEAGDWGTLVHRPFSIWRQTVGAPE